MVAGAFTYYCTKRKEALIGVAYSFFGEPNVAHLKTIYGTDTESDNSPTYGNSIAVGITVAK